MSGDFDTQVYFVFAHKSKNVVFLHIFVLIVYVGDDHKK